MVNIEINLDYFQSSVNKTFLLVIQMLKTLISLIILANVLTAVEPENCNKDVQTLKQVFLVRRLSLFIFLYLNFLCFQIHRHGDRTPIDFYPRDPYRNSSLWPDGFGQLTKVIKKRC